MENGERIQKVLAQAGIASRREIERMIEDGLIKVNGKKAKTGQKITGKESIMIGKRTIHLDRRQIDKNDHQYIIYNKPEGEIVSTNDPEGRPTVFRNLPKIKKGKWIAVGRLDINTRGLLIFTTNGELAHRLMHPSYEIEREYGVRVYGHVSSEVLNNLQQGVELEDGVAQFHNIREFRSEGSNHWYHVTLSEGKNREVRRLWESQEVPVNRLIRIRYGTVNLPRSLKKGKSEEIKKSELKQLFQLVQLDYPK